MKEQHVPRFLPSHVRIDTIKPVVLSSPAELFLRTLPDTVLQAKRTNSWVSMSNSWH